MNRSLHITHYGRKTFLVTTLLALAGALIAYFTEWMIVIPFLFSLGIPLINSHKPLPGKIGTTIFIILGTIAIFTGAVILMLNIEYSRMLLQASVVGIAGCLILILNGSLIRVIRLSLRSVLVTFLLAATSIPAGMWLTERLPATGGSFLASFFGQYGIMILWMLFTTAGIIFGMRDRMHVPEA